MNRGCLLVLVLGLAGVSALAEDTNSTGRFEAALKDYHEYARTNPPPAEFFGALQAKE